MSAFKIIIIIVVIAISLLIIGLKMIGKIFTKVTNQEREQELNEQTSNPKS